LILKKSSRIIREVKSQRKKMTMKQIFTLLACTTILLSACTQGTGPNKQQMGTALGGVLGGIAGNQIGQGSGNTAATIGGTLLGAFLGNSIGTSLDRADMMYYNQAATQAYSAPVGQQINWANPQSGNSGTITPVRDGRASNGSYCREFQQTIFVDGTNQNAYGVACQQPDGTWRIVN
jgi:surface antigen